MALWIEFFSQIIVIFDIPNALTIQKNCFLEILKEHKNALNDSLFSLEKWQKIIKNEGKYFND